MMGQVVVVWAPYHVLDFGLGSKCSACVVYESCRIHGALLQVNGGY